MLHGHERAPELHGDRAVPLVFGDLVHWLDRLLDVRVVEGDVQAAEALACCGQRGFDLLAARDVARDSERLAGGLHHRASTFAGSVGVYISKEWARHLPPPTADDIPGNRTDAHTTAAGAYATR